MLILLRLRLGLSSRGKSLDREVGKAGSARPKGLLLWSSLLSARHPTARIVFHLPSRDWPEKTTTYCLDVPCCVRIVFGACHYPVPDGREPVHGGRSLKLHEVHPCVDESCILVAVLKQLEL